MDRSHCPAGCQDTTKAASGGQPFTVPDVQATPSMTRPNSGNTRKADGTVADPTPLLD